MLDLGLIGFAQPWVLAVLLALPALWWLLRLVPPPPRRERFPAIALLAGLVAREDSSARMPWWLLALRLLLAALVILALADPVFAPQKGLQGKGPLLIVVDNGWASAADWPARERALANLLDAADRTDRPVAILPTAARAEPTEPVSFRPATAWKAFAGALAPHPWPTDRKALLSAIAALQGPGEAVWLSDGVETMGRAEAARRLQRLGRLVAFAPPAATVLLREPDTAGDGLTVSAVRTDPQAPLRRQVQAVAADGRVLAETELAFAGGSATATADWTLPRELLNQARRLRLAGSAGAAGTVLLDDRWQRHLVGIAAAGDTRAGHPLLDPDHYLHAAFADLATFREAPLAALLDQRPSLIVTRTRLEPDEATAVALETWLDAGGVLLRFADPSLAEDPDEWLPVRLRTASRALGGALSWEVPQHLAPFPETSPFAGLAVPEEVTVSRQVLAEPGPDLRGKTWALLADGTPLVTAEARGKGWVVLFHVGAGADWSDLPLSGLFLQMLDRLVRLGHGQSGVAAGDAPLPPRQVLDGFARLHEPSPEVRPLPPHPTATAARLGPRHPPGYYGDETNRFAWNLAPALGAEPPRAIADWPGGVEVRGFRQDRSRDLGAWLLLAAALLLILDTLASLWLRGHLRLATRVAPALAALAAAGLVALLAAAGNAAASDDLALEATLKTHLAYVLTGNPEVDRTSEAGLAGLSHILAARTSVEPGPPIAVDIDSTELAFFPLLYWPVLPDQPLLSARTRDRVSAFMEHGGTILFDTRDQDAGGDTGPGMLRLRQLLAGMRIPPLEPVPPDHVLTRAFYLLREFPGRWEGSPVWIEANAAANRDGVTSIVIGRNDWAAAWALSEDWRPLYPVYPGGDRQRELAYRFGVNLVMHVLTGNYKGDQVHIPDILQRLGQ
ncbi:MAG: DUF4159 domain-containing protein [Alphaproteobacteria bacterium]|nr:DUF4159 domain-containing protein [Alphaproteobacteria bacterium]